MSAAVESEESALVVVTRVGALVRIGPRGALNSERIIAELDSAIRTSAEQGRVKIIVDLGACPLIASAGIELLLDAQEFLLRRGGWLKLATVDELVLEVLEFTDVLSRIALVDAREQNALEERDAHIRGRLGDILIARGHLTEAQAEEAIHVQNTSGKRLGQVVVERGWVNEDDLLDALGVQLGVPVVHLRAGVFDPEIAKLIPPAVARRLSVFGLFRVHECIYVATPTPQALPALDEVRERTGLTARPVLARRDDVLKFVDDGGEGGLLGEHFDTDLVADVDDDFSVVDEVTQDDYTRIDEVAGASPVINLVNSIIQRSIRDGASDIHIEPSQSVSRVRYRIDGVLYQYKTLRPELHAS
ncbi:MAG: STAS domain-containing protein, partial [Pseudomonadota bacterium]